MAFITDAALDAALAVVADSSHLYICSQEPTTYAQATTTYALGSKAAPTIGAAADRAPNGRKVTVSAITDGSVSGTGTAAYWALVKATGSLLRATGAITSPQTVTSPNTFTLAAFDVGVPDAA
jgi:hypothetical protein